jgi:hypothetical protein
MESKTSEANDYVIRIGHGKFTIIDTPGFGDTRGRKVDEENFKIIREKVLS